MLKPVQVSAICLTLWLAGLHFLSSPGVVVWAVDEQTDVGLKLPQNETRGRMLSVLTYIKPRMRDELILDKGFDNLPRDWYDAQCQGDNNDYCRFVGDYPNNVYWSCALAGGTDQYTPAGRFTQETTYKTPCPTGTPSPTPPSPTPPSPQKCGPGGPQCGTDRYCDTITSVFACRSKLGNGQFCLTGDACKSARCAPIQRCVACLGNSHCSSGQYCRVADASFRCVPKLLLNKVCLNDADCASGMCTPTGKCGNCRALDTTTGCRTGLFCSQPKVSDSYRCMPGRANGVACTKDVQCRSGKCCNRVKEKCWLNMKNCKCMKNCKS